MVQEEHGVELSKEDMDAIKAGFDMTDADGDGEVDKAEFEAAIAAAGLAQKLSKLM